MEWGLLKISEFVDKWGLWFDGEDVPDNNEIYNDSEKNGYMILYNGNSWSPSRFHVTLNNVVEKVLDEVRGMDYCGFYSIQCAKCGGVIDEEKDWCKCGNVNHELFEKLESIDRPIKWRQYYGGTQNQGSVVLSTRKSKGLTFRNERISKNVTDSSKYRMYKLFKWNRKIIGLYCFHCGLRLINGECPECGLKFDEEEFDKYIVEYLNDDR